MRLLLLLIMLLPTFVFASKDKGIYVGGSVSLINVGVVDPFQNEVNFKTGEVLVGYKHHPYLGVEMRYGQSLQEESIAVVDPDTGLEDYVSASLDGYYSVYYRPELANEIAKVYLLVGQSSVSTTLEFEDNSGPTYKLTDSGLSYGIGFGLWLNERMNLNFEFKTLVVTENDSFSGATLGADYRF